MPDTLEPLIFDLVEWIEREPRSYGDVIEAWRTSCPRLTVWEDAIDRGFVQRLANGSGGMSVVVTEAGRLFLCERRAGAISSPGRSS
jgi:hypothetical protein